MLAQGSVEDLYVWNPWTPTELQGNLRKVHELYWYVVGGWALDLFLGVQTRVHEDFEFAVFHHQLDAFSCALADFEFYAVNNGRLTRVDREKPWPTDVWQFWVADLRNSSWRFDMMIDKGTADDWYYKRDPALRLSRTRSIRETEAGIKYLAPALVLLFKAKHCREKDEQDFACVRPSLSTRDRQDLRTWLEMLHPNHHWIKQL